MPYGGFTAEPGGAQQYADLSSNNLGNGPVDLAAYKAVGHATISLKASEGTGYVWFAGSDLHAQAHAHGLRVERYHWLRPENSAVAQADYFFNAVRALLKPGDRLMCDFETSYNYSTGQTVPESAIHRARQLKRFMRRLRKRCLELTFDVELRVYTGNWYLAHGSSMQRAARRYRIVMSDYSGVTSLPNDYGLHYVAWQFTDRAVVPGVPGTTDYNRELVAPHPRPRPKPKPHRKPRHPNIAAARKALTRAVKRHPDDAVGKSAAAALHDLDAAK